jgi:hypothetical protein
MLVAQARIANTATPPVWLRGAKLGHRQRPPRNAVTWAAALLQPHTRRVTHGAELSRQSTRSMPNLPTITPAARSFRFDTQPANQRTHRLRTVTLAPLQVAADAKPKRIATATKRTTAWLDECLRLHTAFQQQQQQHDKQQQQEQQQEQQQGQQQQQDAAAAGQAAGEDRGTNGAGTSGPLTGSLLLAALGGGGVAAERARAAEAAGSREGVGGERFGWLLIHPPRGGGGEGGLITETHDSSRQKSGRMRGSGRQ